MYTSVHTRAEGALLDASPKLINGSDQGRSEMPRLLI